MDLLDHDRDWTERNRSRLFRNQNLLHWYRRLYQHQFAGLGEVGRLKVLEVGSGTSPLKHFYPSVCTSDLMELDYLDYRFDCHDIDRFAPIADRSLDVITLTNVLHHLREPLEFLARASQKLKAGGQLILTEPYFSSLSRPLYLALHREPSRFDLDQPVLDGIRGPLSTANMAIPYLMFFSERGWLARLAPYYELSRTELSHFSALSYMASGGISMRLPVPGPLFRALFGADQALASRWPRLFSSFFTARLYRRDNLPASSRSGQPAPDTEGT